MALSIRDDETERLARSISADRKISMTATIRTALRHEAGRNVGDEDASRRFDVAVRRAQQMVRNTPYSWIATTDEILGYGEDGIPEQR